MPKAKDIVAIGIDLGTTHCCVAHINRDGVVDIIANKDGDRTTPSYIVLTKTEIIIGKIAKEEYFKPPENVVYDSKRLIGRNFNDKYIQNDIKKWTFKVKNRNNKPIIELTNENEPVCYRPEEISAMLLEHMKKTAEEFIGKSVTAAVITVPAHFNYHQRAATTEAGKLAGLNVLGTINEPTAAALAYIHKNNITDPKNILIYDLGGGTFDVSIVNVKPHSITVMASGGNTHLGGRDFDNNLIDLINKKIEKRFKKEVLNSEVIQRRIKAASERIKIKLSTIDTTVMDLDRFHDEEDVEVEISREEFEEINSDLFKATIDIVQHCLIDANLKNIDIDDVVLVGGSTRIPKIQEVLSGFFNGKKLSKTVNPDEAVAYGAAVQTQKFVTSNKTEVTKINDVTSLSLGIEVLGDIVSTIIARNTPIPCSYTKSFSTSVNNQARARIKIYEGERVLNEDNIFLGECSLALPPKPPGYSIDLTFTIDENGIIQVTARNEQGLHKTLSMIYKEQSSKSVNDILNDAKTNRLQDLEVQCIVNVWNDLKLHCTKLATICDYEVQSMSNEDETNVRENLKAINNWISENYTTSNITVIKEIMNKTKEIYENLYPVVEKYGYSDVRNLTLSEFYKVIAKEDD